jgi:hypothetical protein
MSSDVPPEAYTPRLSEGGVSRIPPTNANLGSRKASFSADNIAESDCGLLFCRWGTSPVIPLWAGLQYNSRKCLHWRELW